jgi:hypothetical protein
VRIGVAVFLRCRWFDRVQREEGKLEVAALGIEGLVLAQKLR